ncbi:two-component system response regulator [Pseudocolwellia agarivorans]|uniref:two-component system response regulator n=1 Tax=Pseudocolwellia agarivorans TaxID=1911682 RepID=UPI000987898A|nr:EAL domain-containing protein [Pseudocolwellia agarivorans]
MNILLVDDDEVDRKLIKRALTNDANVRNLCEVSSAIEGLKLAETGEFDVLLLDYMMPEIDGIEMVIEIRSRPNLGETAIIMMSSSEDEELALSCLHAGAQDFITKKEITSSKLKRSLLQAKKRFEMEKKLHDSFCQVRELAEKDSLTGLSNRYHFEDALKVSINNNKRSNDIIALLFLDLDHFKNINDTYGHEMGDMFLKEVAKRTNQCLRGNELFARLGGDEFAILLTGLKNDNDATTVARRIIKALGKTIVINENQLQCGVSIGIALYPNDADSAETLKKYADIAMYRAKKEGRNQLCYFEPLMQQQFSRNFQIETQLKESIKNNDFELHYQPVISTLNKKMIGVEALIRWPNSPFICYPDEFIPVAEQSRIIEEIGEWVLETGIKQLSLWQTKFDDEFTMAINISAIQLESKNLTSTIKKTLKAYNVPSKSLILELTETALLVQDESNRMQINELCELGCKLALDDFGTGFSSLSHLVNFPINTVKIDKSLLPTSDRETRHLSIVKGITKMVNTIGLHIIAEGVETEYQYELCKQLEISELQGYFFDKAMPSDELERKWLFSNPS